MKNNAKLSIMLKGFIKENPVFVLVLGTCPTLALTSSIVSAFCVGIAATIVLVCSNVVISALRKVIPDVVRIPCYIVVIAAFVTAVQMLMQAYLAPLYDLMGVYLALIVVNCIILGRAEMFARKNPIGDSALDGLGMGIGFLIALVAMATVREVLGTGMISLSAFDLDPIRIPLLATYNIPLLVQAPGGFLVYGIFIAIVNKIGPKAGAEKRKNFSCEGCPSAAFCGKVSCVETSEIVAAAEEASGANETKEVNE